MQIFSGTICQSRMRVAYYPEENHRERRVREMKIAVASENNQVCRHFGHTPEFAVFEIENGAIRRSVRKSCGEAGHAERAGLLAECEVDLVICGGIGPGAARALTDAGIVFVGGASGDVRTAAERYLAGTLPLIPDLPSDRPADPPEKDGGA